MELILLPTVCLSSGVTVFEASPDSDAAAEDHQQRTRVFLKGNPLPSLKSLTLFRPGTFTIDVQYANAADQLQVPVRINT
ncbi:hypothetical protein MKW98_003853, partial [Papaver atlanticum]